MTTPHDHDNEPVDEPVGDPIDGDDPAARHLGDAGARLRADAQPPSAAAIQLAVLERRSRRLTLSLAAAVVVLALGAGAFAVGSLDRSSTTHDLASNARPTTPAQRKGVEDLVASLAHKPPVDPTKVQLVSTVSTFGDCNALIGELRTVGARHVGSRGFGDLYGGYGYSGNFRTVGASTDKAILSSQSDSLATTGTDQTLGTNVQVQGADELDSVKAEGDLIYDLDGKGNLRITEAKTLEVRATLDVTPKPMGPSGGGPNAPKPQPTMVSQLFVDHGRVVIFGSETEISKPVAGDPSATRATTSYLTVTMVDATDPSAPKVTDRVRIEGGLVSARLVGGQVRLVTTANMADLGFVVPTTPNSVAKALEENRRSVASSTAADWIPDYQRAGGTPQPLVPCDRVHVPDTFSGVAMTSMVTFPATSGRFDPQATSIVAPGDTLYAGLDTVAISSEVWVDPIDRERLKFDHWQTAIHEFTFDGASAPGYEGSGIVDGSTVGQFAFGELGGSLAVVTTKGTPWNQDQKAAVNLTVLAPDGKGHLAERAKVADLADGKGAVVAVRFVTGRVLVSTGLFGRLVRVIDVTDPAHPRRAGSVTVPGAIDYFHPLPDDRALMLGSRTDTVGTGKDERSRSWVQAHLLDVHDADAPKVVATWEQPWTSDSVGYDHHGFTYWPTRHLAAWGLADTQGGSQRPNHAAFLDVEGGITEKAFPVASRPAAVPSPCPSVTVPDSARNLIGGGTIVLRCADPGTRTISWPRYQCYKLDSGTVARFVAEDQRKAAFFRCELAPMPHVARVLVVSGRPILLTDQTLEALDPSTFASTAIAYHPSDTGYGY